MRVQCFYPRFVFSPPLSFPPLPDGLVAYLVWQQWINSICLRPSLTRSGRRDWEINQWVKTETGAVPPAATWAATSAALEENPTGRQLKVEPIYPTMRKLSIKGKQTWIRKRLPPPNAHCVNSGKDASVSLTASARALLWHLISWLRVQIKERSKHLNSMPITWRRLVNSYTSVESSEFLPVCVMANMKELSPQQFLRRCLTAFNCRRLKCVHVEYKIKKTRAWLSKTRTLQQIKCSVLLFLTMILVVLMDAN